MSRGREESPESFHGGRRGLQGSGESVREHCASAAGLAGAAERRLELETHGTLPPCPQCCQSTSLHLYRKSSDLRGEVSGEQLHPFLGASYLREQSEQPLHGRVVFYLRSLFEPNIVLTKQTLKLIFSEFEFNLIYLTLVNITAPHTRICLSLLVQKTNS